MGEKEIRNAIEKGTAMPYDDKLMWEAYRGVKDKYRTKADLRKCGCVNCREALKRLRGERCLS